MFNIFKKKQSFLIIFFFILLFSVISVITLSHFKIYNKENINVLKYEEIIKKIYAKKPKDSVIINKFIVQNKNIYSALILMLLAKKDVLSHNLDKAVFELKSSLNYINEENLKNIVLLRISKINIEQKKFLQALNILNNIKNPIWSSVIENMKGDIFMIQKQFTKAFNAWNKSYLLKNSDILKDIIQMKLNTIKQIS